MREREEYLADVARQLRLPDPWASEVIEELAGHIDDTTSELRAVGIPDDDAVRGALRRLGAPAELADRIASAHQTRLRLLAGAGGGAVAAAAHGLAGSVVGLAYATLGSLLLTVLVQAAGRLTGTEWSLAVSDQGWNTLLLAIALNLAALAAGRAAVGAVAATSRRRAGDIRTWTAAIGALVLLPTIFVVKLSLPLNFVSAVALLVVPAAFATGALRPMDTPWLLGRRALIVVAVAFVLSMLVISGIGMRVEGGGTSVEYDSPEEMWAGMHFDLIGREVVRHGDYPFGGSGWFQETDGAVRVELEATSAIAAREWRDLRLEAWHALPSSMGVDPNYDAPFVSVPVEAVDGTVEATLALSRTPGVANWWVALTGLGSDGERYVLSAPAGGNTTFRGSVWDWFTLSHNAAGN